MKISGQTASLDETSERFDCMTTILPDFGNNPVDFDHHAEYRRWQFYVPVLLVAADAEAPDGLVVNVDDCG